MGAACADKEAELLPATNQSALRRDAYFPKRGIILPWCVYAQIDVLRSPNEYFAPSVKGKTAAPSVDHHFRPVSRHRWLAEDAGRRPPESPRYLAAVGAVHTPVPCLSP